MLVGSCDLAMVAVRVRARLWIQYLQSQDDCWESLAGEDQALWDIKERPGDSRPIRQKTGEVNGSLGSYGQR